MPNGAGIVRPVTAEEQDAVGQFLAWVADVLDVAEARGEKAELARKAVCPA